ncbi:MAG: lmo0937 family membrane protein, partial [Anaerolineales bacterium]|nr:lmo0937 family membrane protein [Anaerolineales bacterium]
VLWLLGFLGGSISPRFPKMGNAVHILIVIAIILVVLQLLGVVNL